MLFSSRYSGQHCFFLMQFPCLTVPQHLMESQVPTGTDRHRHMSG
jgi:hypothetical protein